MRVVALPQEASFNVSQRLEQMMGPHSVIPYAPSYSLVETCAGDFVHERVADEDRNDQNQVTPR